MRLVLIICCSFFLVSCNQDSLMPNDIGEELFEIFRTNETDNLKALLYTKEDELKVIELGKDRLEFDFETKKKIHESKTNDSLRAKINQNRFESIKEEFDDSRNLLLEKLQTDIASYRLQEIYAEVEEHDAYDNEVYETSAYIFLEIVNNTMDKHYIAFEVIKIDEDQWKLSDYISIEDTLYQGFQKYENVKL